MLGMYTFSNAVTMSAEYINSVSEVLRIQLTQRFIFLRAFNGKLAIISICIVLSFCISIGAANITSYNFQFHINEKEKSFHNSAQASSSELRKYIINGYKSYQQNLVNLVQKDKSSSHFFLMYHYFFNMHALFITQYSEI